MAKEIQITIPAQSLSGERRTFQADHFVEKGKDPIINFKRETWTLGASGGAEVPRDVREHQRMFSAVARETVQVPDVNGVLVTLPVASVLVAESSLYDRWASEDGEA